MSAMGAALKRNPGLVRVADLSETRICPLAHAVRKRLHKEGVMTGVRCVFSLERPADAVRPGQPEAQGLDRGRTRTILGSLCTIPGIFGLAAAGEALERLAAGASPGLGGRDVGPDAVQDMCKAMLEGKPPFPQSVWFGLKEA